MALSYAKTNLREVRDSAAEHGLSGQQEARFPRRDLGAEQTSTACRNRLARSAGVQFFQKPSDRARAKPAVH